MLSAMPKIFESILTDDIFHTYKHHIAPEQHGFFKGRSTSSNLALYQDFIISSVESGKQVEVIYTDLARAFDSVCHTLLIQKLARIGISGSYLKCISSYLTGRRQCVSVCGSFSDDFIVTSGVPQGSHIGPVLFLLFFNDVVGCFEHSQCLLYADDLKFFSVSEGCGDLQGDLDRLVEWCDNNYLSLNVVKCKSMRFSRRRIQTVSTYLIKNENIETVASTNDLGVIFQSDLSFNLHIDSIVLKALRMLGFIRRSTKYVVDTRAIVCLYYSFVRSILEYCSGIWSPTYACHIDRIERVQNKFVKYLLYKFHFPYAGVPYEVRLQLCGMKSLEQRRKEFLLLFLFKLTSGLTDCGELLEKILFKVPTRPTRQTQLFYEMPHRTNYGTCSFMDRMMKNYNVYFSNHDIFSFRTLPCFKRSISCN